MKTTHFYVSLAMIAFLSLSFRPPSEDGLNVSYGAYGSTPAKIELQLHDDFTFSYHDHSVPGRTVEVEGSYTLDGNKVLLTSDTPGAGFRDKWKIKNEGTSIVSSKGLCYYILRTR